MILSKSEIVDLISAFHNRTGKVPTISLFAKENEVHASSIVRKYGSWNDLLKSAGLKLNKASKRSEDQLIAWLKTHPNARYSEIPFGIRSALEEKFKTIANARVIAGLSITDWRSAYRPRQGSSKSGRPVEYKKEEIIKGLRLLAINLGRPPRMKDISKKACGFPISALLLRFGTFNNALKEASLPPAYSHQEENKMIDEVCILLLNIKLELKDYPLFCNIGKTNTIKPIFIYDDRLEYVILLRSSIKNYLNDIAALESIDNRNIVIWYLVDDSLCEYNFSMKYIMDLKNYVKEELSNKIHELRLKYDEISRKYIGQSL